jgi:hypothetical protein
MKKFLLLILSLISISAFSSIEVDRAYLWDCGGKVILKKSDENLHLHFKDVMNCSNLKVMTSYYGSTLKSYKLNSGKSYGPYTANFTLSKSMWRELERDGSMNLRVTSNSGATVDNVTLIVPRYSSYNPYNPGYSNPKKCGGHSNSNFTGWALTNSCKCAYYQNGQFHHHAKPHQEYKCN